MGALFTFNIHNNVDLSSLEKELKYITQKLSTMAKKIDDINALLSEINDSTNNIAADLDRIAQQAEGGLSAEEADGVVSQLRSASEALKAVAAKNPETGEPTTPAV
jgi:methyl-accepting chemotaxis protein